jgi:hypothetical protein
MPLFLGACAVCSVTCGHAYETCVLTCRINFYCTFSLRRLGLMRLSASLLSSDLATQHNTAMQAESACMRE